MAIHKYLKGAPRTVQVDCESGDGCGAVLDLEQHSTDEVRFSVVGGLGSVVVSEKTLKEALKLLMKK